MMSIWKKTIVRAQIRNFLAMTAIILAPSFVKASDTPTVDDCSAPFGDQAILRRTYSYHFHSEAWNHIVRNISQNFEPVLTQVKNHTSANESIADGLKLHIQQMSRVENLKLASEEEVEKLANFLLDYFNGALIFLGVLQTQGYENIDIPTLQMWTRALLSQTESALVWMNQEISGNSLSRIDKPSSNSSSALHLRILNEKRHQIYLQQLEIINKVAFFSVTLFTASKTTLQQWYGISTDLMSGEEKNFLEAPVVRINIPVITLSSQDQEIGPVMSRLRTIANQPDRATSVLFAPNLQLFNPLTRMLNTPADVLTIDAKAIAMPEILDLEQLHRLTEVKNEKVLPDRAVLSTWDSSWGRREISAARILSLQSNLHLRWGELMRGQRFSREPSFPDLNYDHQLKTLVLAYPSDFLRKLKVHLSRWRVSEPVDVSRKWNFAISGLKAFHFQLEVVECLACSNHEVHRSDFVVFATNSNEAMRSMTYFKLKLQSALSELELRHATIEKGLRSN